MAKTVAIHGMTRETRLRVKLLASLHGKTMGEYVQDLIEREWNEDKTELGKNDKSRIRRIIRKWA